MKEINKSPGNSIEKLVKISNHKEMFQEFHKVQQTKGPVNPKLSDTMI